MEQMKEFQVRDFRKLLVYQKAMEWYGEISDIVKKLPWEEKDVIGKQIRRSSSSVSANLAEGNGQYYKQKDIIFINNALGSAAETQMWLDALLQGGYIDQATHANLDEKAIEIRKMLVAMMKKIKNEIEEKKNIA